MYCLIISELSNTNTLVSVASITSSQTSWDKSTLPYKEYEIIVVLTNNMRLVARIPASMISADTISIPLNVYYDANTNILVNVQLTSTTKQYTVRANNYAVDKVVLYGVK